MATAIRLLGHEDRLSLVDHLDELRTRLIVTAITLIVAFGACLWQNGPLLRVVNHPLDQQTASAIKKGRGPLGQTAVTQQALLAVAAEQRAISSALSGPGSGLPPATRAALIQADSHVAALVAKIPKTPTGNKPVTLGIGEPFTATVTIAFYFAVLFALPMILFQIYAFVLPAFSPSERKVALPVMLMVPFLFIAGVVFGYFVVLPAAVRFLQNFNSDSYNVLVQAKDYYKFVAVTLALLGLIFQIPVGIIAITRAGILTPAQLRKNRRYAIVAAAAVAAIAPGDIVTMLLEMVPIIVLFELSIVLAAFMERRAAAAEARASTAVDDSEPPVVPGDPEPPHDDPPPEDAGESEPPAGGSAPPAS
jgi:sec-independent protein translocase protein TatC